MENVEIIKITGEHIRLCDLLKFTSLCQTGGEAKIVISDGLVTVNGEVCTMRGKKIFPGDVVEYQGRKIGAAR